ncbi:S41 family peptidase [Bacteroides sp. 51]|uniref:S41 family peptidase n=1 Tax=Bacteroides sp. 51 TaxID=2302938 RepID=UPI001EF1C55D|nr:S41 family peptidase [Bacteroides sp. 51]
MRSFLKFLVFIAVFSFSSCVKEEKMADTPLGNFEELWKIIDERYCFLEYKEIDWDGLYTEYRKYISDDMPDEELFNILARMLDELKDGHVNLYSDNEITYYTHWFDEYPRNFNEVVLMHYLAGKYRAEGSIRYAILEGNIGYIHCDNFSATMSNDKLNTMLKYMSGCDGLIVDVRNNSGGSIGNATLLASHFTAEKKLVGYIQHKTGKGHGSFSTPQAIYIDPSVGIHWSKPVVVLANRQTFSAGNYFVNMMRYFPQVTTMGDVTGGGSGLPFTSELPNGWGVRFSASPHYDADMNHIEFGIEPEHRVNMSPQDEEKGIDTIIEKARFLLGFSTFFSK